MKSTTYIGDCRDILSMFYEDNTFDSIVTDPPYGLGFMGKGWDNSVPGVEFWTEILRVLKPGGHLLSFSGSRTYHRMACAIEDAGFEMRDQIMWVYGSGFPKSLDVSKAIDKAAGAEREILSECQVSGIGHNGNAFKGHAEGATQKFYGAPSIDATKQWQGWGTALKPAHEPICVARKPLIGTVAANVLQFGTGGLNIDACRVAGEAWKAHTATGLASKFFTEGYAPVIEKSPHMGVRWPANLIHDGSDEVLAAFPYTESGKPSGIRRAKSEHNVDYADMAAGTELTGYGNAGSAARFFYCAKTSKSDRNAGCESIAEKQYSHDGRETPIDNAYQRNANAASNCHPTVKPTDLMAYLCRLVTPLGGTILDPFMGSGSTGKAALREGFNFVGIDLDAHYVAIADARMAA